MKEEETIDKKEVKIKPNISSNWKLSVTPVGGPFAVFYFQIPILVF